MEHWKRTIEAGNRCFIEGDWVKARELYLQALAEAQVLYGRWPDHNIAVASFVISHHNLADLHLKLGHPGEAAENLCTCHERLLQTLADGSLAEGLRSAAMHHSRRTYIELLQFIAEHGAYPRTNRLLCAPQRQAWRDHATAVETPSRHYHYERRRPMAHSLPDLPYAYDALEPHIDAQTMEIHYSKHHQTYINNLNAALEGFTYADWPVEELLGKLKELPQALHAAVINQGGGHANHTLFWSVMAPTGGGEPSGELAAAIDEQLGGFAAFKDAFTKAALSRFGSGWAWLSVTPEKKLVVESSANQDSPLMQGNTPILGLDVWEHAYYLRYQNRRPEYIGAFYNVIDWSEVARRYRDALSAG